MRQVKRRSPLPVYIAAAVFALYALVAPLYSLWHFLLAALVTAGAWLLADKLVGPVVEYVPEPEKPATPEELIMKEAATARSAMERLSASIGDAAMAEKIAQLISLSDRIAQDARQDPADIPQIQKFQSYFLPSTVALLNAYDRMSGLDVEGENISGSKERIAQMLDTEIQAFQKQLDALYKNDAMDIDADIRVMQSILDREGLGQDDELQKLLKKTQGSQQ